MSSTKNEADGFSDAELVIVETVKVTRLALAKAEAARDEMLIAYAKRRPLTEAEHQALIEHTREGGALCCHGISFLQKLLPEPWAQAINGWAYEHLSCTPTTDERRDRYVTEVTKLKRDKLPKLS